MRFHHERLGVESSLHFLKKYLRGREVTLSKNNAERIKKEGSAVFGTDVQHITSFYQDLLDRNFTGQVHFDSRFWSWDAYRDSHGLRLRKWVSEENYHLWIIVHSGKLLVNVSSNEFDQFSIFSVTNQGEVKIEPSLGEQLPVKNIGPEKIKAVLTDLAYQLRRSDVQARLLNFEPS